MTVKGANIRYYNPDPFDNRVGSKIKELRKNANMTIDEFSEATNLSHRTISNYENGKNTISIQSLIKIYESIPFHDKYNNLDELFTALISSSYYEEH